MEKIINMEEKLKKILLEYKDSTNNDLEFALKTLEKDFNDTKTLLVKLTHHLDSLENNYNTVLKEYRKRKVND